MKVHLIKQSNVNAYIRKHATSGPGFSAWYAQLKTADWKTVHDLRASFPSADIIGYSRLVFNIGGNKHRMICKYHFGAKTVRLFVLWIGTHAEYDKLCKEGKQYTVEQY